MASSHCEVASRKRQQLHIYDLPCEIMAHIFLRLFVKCLVRAKCTCKLWYALISEPTFIDMQFNRALKNPGRLYDLGANSYFVEGASDIEATLEIPYESLGLTNHGLVSSGGLVAYYLDRKNGYLICNPITREQIKVPMHPYFDVEMSVQRHGFGYSASTKEYKMVVFGPTSRLRCTVIGHPSIELNYEYWKYNIPHVGAIHTLGSESWRHIPHIPFQSDSYDFIDCDGTLFWLVHRADNVFPEEIIGSFDLGSEEFRGLHGPYGEIRNEMSCFYRIANNMNITLFLIKLGETVGFVRCSEYLNFSIWTLRDKVNEVWIKDYNFTSSSSFTSNVKLIGLWMSGALLAYYFPLFSFSPYKAIRQKRRCVTYNTNSEEFEDLELPFTKELSEHECRYLEESRIKKIQEAFRNGGLRQPTWIITHVGSLISPKQIVAMAMNKSSYSGHGPLAG